MRRDPNYGNDLDDPRQYASRGYHTSDPAHRLDNSAFEQHRCETFELLHQRRNLQLPSNFFEMLWVTIRLDVLMNAAHSSITIAVLSSMNNG